MPVLGVKRFNTLHLKSLNCGYVEEKRLPSQRTQSVNLSSTLITQQRTVHLRDTCTSMLSPLVETERHLCVWREMISEQVRCVDNVHVNLLIHRRIFVVKQVYLLSQIVKLTNKIRTSCSVWTRCLKQEWTRLVSVIARHVCWGVHPVYQRSAFHGTQTKTRKLPLSA